MKFIFICGPGAKENVAYLTSTERRREAEKAALQSEKHSVAAAASVPTRFKDLVEKSAEENGFLFIPIPNRRHDGKAVYSFGKCLVYIDRDVVFYYREGKWQPTSIHDLLALAT